VTPEPDLDPRLGPVGRAQAAAVRGILRTARRRERQSALTNTASARL
jgi:hypothetical protein